MRRALLILLSAAPLLLTAGGAAGEDEQTLLPEARHHRRSVEILAAIEQPEGDKSWLSHHLDRIHVNRKTGFAYTQPLNVADHDVELSLRGPALDRKRLGLSFEIRF